MARLNTKKVKASIPAVTNRAGGVAYSQSDELQLAGILLSSFFSGGDTYYEGNGDRVRRLNELVSKVSPAFSARAAIYARDQFGMRTASHLVAKQLATESANKFPKTKFYEKVVIRPDDMLEIAASILAEKDASLPNAVKRAFARVLSTLNEYELTKYKALGKNVNMYDLVNLVHPKATAALSAFMKGESKAPETYEVKLTQAGQNIDKDLSEEEKAVQVAENKKDAWKSLVLSGKIGYFALLRNLRNIVQQADEETIKMACKLLIDKKRITGSRVMPFRFVTAYYELASEKNHQVLTAISDALNISLENIPSFSGKTLICVDESGSMKSKNGRSSVSNRDLACIFAAALVNKNPDCDVMAFSDTAKYVTINLRRPIIDAPSMFPNTMQGTNFNSIFRLALQRKVKYDRIIILSDMQGWMKDNGHDFYSGYRSPVGGAPKGTLDLYMKATGADPIIYSWDLAGYGDMMFSEKKVITLAGWMGDKVFDLMSKVEGGLKGIVDAIWKVEL